MEKIDQIIDRLKQADRHALDQLIVIAYSRLHASARKALGFYGNNASIQATELVNELYLHFRKQKDIDFESAEHFFAIAALKLRQILNTRHEKKTAQKRNCRKKENLSIIEDIPGTPSSVEIFILNDYLDFIKTMAPINARIAELKLFWEFDNVEVAGILGLSESSVRRKWKATKAVIAKKIKEN